MAETILAGGDFMIDSDNQARPDEAGAALRAVPSPPASTTFIALARRFDDVSIGDLGDAMGVLVRRAFAALPEARRRDLASQRPTIDLDPTDIEVYGSKKEGVAYNYAGQRAGRAHPAVWAEAGMVLAADLGSGVDDPRRQAPSLIARAAAALPEGPGRPRVRADSGFFDKAVAGAAIANRCDFAIAAKRNKAVWRAARSVGAQAWQPASGMTGAGVATCPYVPGGWPEGTRTIVRRVRLDGDELPATTADAAMTQLAADHRRLLGNGYCNRPAALDCAFESICERCGFFEAGAEFVPVLLRQRDHAADHGQPDRARLFAGLLDNPDSTT